MEVRAVNGRMAVRALRLEIESGRPNRAEPQMELGDGRMARNAELPDTLIVQHMAIGRAMRRMASRTTFDT